MDLAHTTNNMAKITYPLPPKKDQGSGKNENIPPDTNLYIQDGFGTYHDK